ncbi:hypothetical protein HBI56_029230 [Parastagonospora nodorum]|nr:hypothetical protein HBH53_030000 [Parastagonospora nodorum]KAH3969479.1 hypothetical protein HBH51_122150 [Parastagonospora nodorum]KAH3990820.1 hypothetical protein HBH52_006990 [Parastagonospora nodorum]KAH4006771.1 hypothetical protein HBI10_017420 [Parastagonospora nodorum]KAH4015467.1 hypothetical protein HBI13_163210 [Parastagonospora nodorum]
MVASQRVRGLEMFGGVTTAPLGAEMKALFRVTGSARGPGPRRRRAGREGTHEPGSGQDAGPVQERVGEHGWATHATRRLESRHQTGLAQSGRPAEFAVARDRPWQDGRLAGWRGGGDGNVTRESRDSSMSPVAERRRNIEGRGGWRAWAHS